MLTGGGASGGSGAGLTIDPHAVLGVPVGAPAGDVRAAYRRLARVVHPDVGGTDELFRVVGTAHDVLTGVPGVRRRKRPSRSYPPRGAYPPPPPPPPPRGPYRAPRPEDRRTPALWRSWLDLAQHVGTLVAAAAVGVVAFRLSPLTGILALAAAIGFSAPVLQPAYEGALRAGVVLLGSRVRIPPAVDPERFLEETCLDAPVGRQREDQLYAAYLRWCRTRGEPVASWIFVERLRALGLLFIKSSSWDTGLWVGVSLRR